MSNREHQQWNNEPSHITPEIRSRNIAPSRVERMYRMDERRKDRIKSAFWWAVVIGVVCLMIWGAFNF